MERKTIDERKNYAQKIEELGFFYHPDYWGEGRYYEFTSEEVTALERATQDLYSMVCDAVEYLITHDRLPEMQIPVGVKDYIRQSWERDELSVYGRFDLFFDGREIKLYEFNADTPTSLLESAIIQWNWKEDCFPDKDQYNSIHEGLVQSWKDMYKPRSSVHFVGSLENNEDTGTLQYLASTAMDAGISTRVMDIADMNLNEGQFYDPSGERITDCFKLYPWEWMIGESEVGCLADIHWIEPIWKAVMSNKAILTVLYELFPNSPYVLPAFLSRPQFGIFCKKPIYSREGHNVSIVEVHDWNEKARIAETAGDYGEEGYVYQAYIRPTPYQGRYPIVGSWVIGGEPAGIGIRENNNEITDNLSEFVPHIF